MIKDYQMKWGSLIIRNGVVAYGAILAVISLSDQVKADTTEDFVKFFAGHCIRTVHDIGQLKAFADILKWKKLPDNLQSALFPSIANEADGWVVEDFGQQFLVGYTIGNIEGRKIVSCAVAGRPHIADSIASILRSRFSLNLISDEVEGFQRYQTFSTNVSGNKLILTILSEDNKKPGPVNLAAQIFVDSVSAPLSTPKRKVKKGGCILTGEQKAAFRKKMCSSREYSWIKGPDCGKKIFHRRAKDTGIQVAAAHLCGLNSEANKLEELMLGTLPHIVKLYQCIEVNFDTESIFLSGFEAGKREVKGSGQECSPRFKSRLRRRLPQLLLLGVKNLKAGKDLNRKLGIR